MDKRIIANDELQMMKELISHGRKAAALDGIHLIIWGGISSIALTLQYFAEVHDWASSDELWLWQPLFVLGFVISIFLAKSGAGKRLGNPICSAYASAFSAVGIAIGLFLIASGISGRPEPISAIILLSGLLFIAFFVLATVTNIRWMFIPACGWLALMSYYAFMGMLVPTDFLVLALSALLLLALPGARLKWEQRK